MLTKKPLGSPLEELRESSSTSSSIGTGHRSGLQFRFPDDEEVVHPFQHQKHHIRSEPRISVSSTIHLIFSLLSLDIAEISCSDEQRRRAFCFREFLLPSCCLPHPLFNLRASLTCFCYCSPCQAQQAGFTGLIPALEIVSSVLATESFSRWGMGSSVCTAFM